MMRVYTLFFFFQAEDGIRFADVTGVQTCALRISPLRRVPRPSPGRGTRRSGGPTAGAIPRVPIGRASGRGRGEISVVAVSLKKKKNETDHAIWGMRRAIPEENDLDRPRNPIGRVV